MVKFRIIKAKYCNDSAKTILIISIKKEKIVEVLQFLHFTLHG